MSLKSNQLKKTLSGIQHQPSKQVCLATVNSFDEHGVYVTFYGEADASLKAYRKLASYSPAVGDAVVMMGINKSYIIVGKVV